MKYRIRVIEASADDRGHVVATEFVNANSIAEAEAEATENWRADRFLVEPMVPCTDCGREMGQTDPRTARYPNGDAVHADPDHAYDNILCLECGSKRRMALYG